MAKANLTAQRLRELLHYDQDTGVFRRVMSRQKYKAGSIAGSKTSLGYINIIIESRSYKAHRLAWLYVFGRFPSEHLDHINGEKSDNRIENLREASRQMNLQNIRKAMKTNKSSGMLGVSSDRGRWRARIDANGKCFHIGYFDTPEEAHAAYVEAKRRLHVGCTL